MDLTKAFDMLNHARLLEKIKSYGVTGVVFTWFTGYLFLRFQVIKLGQEFSDPRHLTCGVPQGPILDPIWFLLFLDDIIDCLYHSNVGFLMIQ